MLILKFILLQGSLPDNLPRAFHGPVTPIILLKLVSKGVLEYRICDESKIF